MPPTQTVETIDDGSGDASHDVARDEVRSSALDGSDRSPIGRIRSIVGGVIGAGAALAAGEVVTQAIDPGPSLVTAVGSEFIDRYAASLKDLAVSLFGTNDKKALLVGIVVTALVAGGAFGLAARRWRGAYVAGIVAFGGLGAWALTTDPQGRRAPALIGAAAAIVAGVGVFGALDGWFRSPRRAETSTPEHSVPQGATPHVGRRAFLVGGGTAIVTSAALAAFSRQLAAKGSVEQARRTTRIPRPATATLPPETQPFAAPGLTPYVTSNADFYRIDTALSSPQVDASAWSLTLDGMVDEPVTIDYDELLSMDSVAETVTIQCVSNEVGGGLVGNAVWQGVPLATLLDRAGVASGAEQVVGHSIDGWTAGFPIGDATDGRTALVAYAMNDEPLPVEHGYPARLVVAGLYGYVSATKWLTRIELTTWDGFDGFWVPRGWSKEGPIKTACRIDVPGGGRIEGGRQAIAGVAWAPLRGIERVEVRVDDGEWQAAQLGRSASSDTWVQWYLPWMARPGEHLITARATDGSGAVQTDEVAAPAPNGATGLPTRMVTVA